ncbi:iron-sulfur cluster assembly accessory protein [Balneolales bacterium ANBcel1]|nr:iron-sulfur cluster assembly accessory protein [Balneolales bacterium ANBcel1]
MAIKISENARERIRDIRLSEGASEDTALRIGVVGGGCSGLTYKLDFDESGASEERKDKMFDVDGIRVVIDMRSFLYLAGTELDYSDGLEGKGFHFVNPNAARTCSCGESFSV